MERIQKDRLTPVAVSTDMVSFFIDLAAKDLPHLTELGTFLMALPSGALEDALLQQALPSAHREVILTMRKQHVALQEQLENEIRNQRFAAACAFRDQQALVVQTIRTVLSGSQLQMTPSIVKTALQGLGWQQM